MMRCKIISPICLVAFMMTPSIAAATGWNCTARLICNDAYPCDPDDASRSLGLRIIETDGPAMATIWTGADGASESMAMSLLSQPGAVPRHFLHIQDDGTAMLLTVFGDGALLATSQGLVLGSPYLGSATGHCEDIG